jgi:hypothetical protein
MQVAFRLAYAIVVAMLLILFAILGIRIVYPEPEEPRYPYQIPPASVVKELYCAYEGPCYADGVLLTPESEAGLSETEREYVRQMREYNTRQRDYQQERTDYHRNVMIAATVLGALAVAGGLLLYRRVEAMPLGLILGGVGIISYGWAQAGDEFDEIGPTAPFIAVGLGLATVLAAGYYLLGVRGQPPGGSGAG